MKWIKKNKITCIVLLLFVIISIIGYKAINVFFPNSNTAYYGDRLDGKVNVDKETYETLKSKISEQEFVKEVDVRESGRIINITVTVMDSTSKDAAKGIVKFVLEPFSESQIGYYDFQVFIDKESEEENDYPIIAYKHHNNLEFSWSRDRDKVVDSEEEGE